MPRRFHAADERELLRWAILYLEEDLETLVTSYSTRDGRIEPPEIRREVQDVKAWIGRAREIAPPSPPLTHTTRPPRAPP